MKFRFFISAALAIACSLAALAQAPGAAVRKDPATGAVLEDVRVGSGRTLYVTSGGTIDATGASLVGILGSASSASDGDLLLSAGGTASKRVSTLNYTSPTLTLPNTSSADGGFVNLKFGPAGDMQIRHELSTFNGVQDNVIQFGHHPAQSRDGSAAAWFQIEKNFKNGSGGYDTEYFLQWRGPHATGYVDRRPWQINVSWGAGYATDGTAEGHVDQAYDSDLFRFGNGGGFDDKIRMEFPGNEPDLWLQPKANSKDARLRVARYGASEWLQILAGGGGSYGATMNNAFSIDVVASSNATRRDLFVRRSGNSGAAFDTILNTTNMSGTTPRWQFNGAADDGFSDVNVAGPFRVGAKLVSGSIYQAAMFGRSGAEFVFGDLSGTPAVWSKGNAVSPSSSNWNFYLDGNSTYINGASSTTAVILRSGNDSILTVAAAGAYTNDQRNFSIGTSSVSAGGGLGVLTISTATVPSSNPPAGSFYTYVDPADNKLKARGSSGTVTILANP